MALYRIGSSVYPAERITSVRAVTTGVGYTYAVRVYVDNGGSATADVASFGDDLDAAKAYAVVLEQFLFGINPLPAP